VGSFLEKIAMGMFMEMRKRREGERTPSSQ